MIVAVLTVPMHNDQPLIAGWRPTQKGDPKTGGDGCEKFDKVELHEKEEGARHSGGRTDQEGEQPHPVGETKARKGLQGQLMVMLMFPFASKV